jgi:hypothetical protein
MNECVRLIDRKQLKCRGSRSPESKEKNKERKKEGYLDEGKRRKNEKEEAPIQDFIGGRRMHTKQIREG